MPVLNHTHTYARWKIRGFGQKGARDKIISGEPAMRCIDPDCSHFTQISLVVGKRSKCTKCGMEIILDRESLRRVNPLCLKCGNTKEKHALSNAADMLTDFHLFDSAEISNALDVVSAVHEKRKEGEK